MLADRVIAVATLLSHRAERTREAGTGDFAGDGLSLDQRIAARCPAALHDAIVEAIGHLTAVRDELEVDVIGPAVRGSLARLASMQTEDA